MGEVYRARDTRLDRQVAVKVLASHLSSNPDLRMRFDREARAISKLSHPYICTLYDVGQQDGIDYLVMEYLEGETLADRLGQGPLPLNQVIRFGSEIAEALDKAHRQGIVHRDLKPGNIMITDSGVKVLDFGLAKYTTPEAVLGTQASALATERKPVTAEGTILGTIPYMAPEQLEGKEADARTDIFALGAVLYEMATGKRAFEGQNKASLIASIMRGEPAPITAVQPMSPPALDRVVRTCLEKDPAQRWQSAHDIACQLRWVAEAPSEPLGAISQRRSRTILSWASLSLAVVAALGFAFLAGKTRRASVAMIQAAILPPQDSTFHFDIGPVALSPDGSQLAFVATGAEGRDFVWVRPIRDVSAHALSGTEGASFPFWSPDGRSIGFFADGKLKRIDASGGPALTLCNAPASRGGTWGRNGVILFAPTPRDPIHRISSSGGKAVAVTKIDASETELGHRWPVFLPDGKHFLYLSWTGFWRLNEERGGIYLGAVDSPKRKLLVSAASNAAYAPPGYILFLRGADLMAQSFNLKRYELSGEPSLIAEQVQYYSDRGLVVFSVSGNGLLAYQAGSSTAKTQLTWLDRTGKQIEVLTSQGSYFSPRISHDGQRVAAESRDAQQNPDVWIYDLSRRVGARFTFNPGLESSPVWSPDDSRIVFLSSRTTPGDLYEKDTTGGKERVVFSADNRKEPTDWSPDGRFIVFQHQAKAGAKKMDLWIYSLDERKAVPLLGSEFNEVDGRFSPDGKWIAYVSDESKRYEVYVQPFPSSGSKWQISVTGGFQPRWSGDGKELFYLSLDRRMMSVEVQTSPSFQAGNPKPLFEVRIPNISFGQYDVSSDGERFLMNLPAGDQQMTPITLVTNWSAKAVK